MSDIQHENPPSSQADEHSSLLRPHKYDGIQEYDNPSPLWLMGLFVGTVIFSMVYIPYYLIADAQGTYNPQIALEQEMKEAAAERAAWLQAHPEALPQATEQTLAGLVTSPEAVATGKAQFATSCAACHGAEGQGLVGPNLTDNAWIHGGTLMQIRQSIDKGIPDKGMIAWGPMFKPETIDAMVAFVASIQGSNPPNPKAPQGEVISTP